MANKSRRFYYNLFSRFYDRFVVLHSTDPQGMARKFLSDLVPVGEGDRVLDICTGTGSLLLELSARVGEDGQAVGLDFSRGMLGVCRQKTSSHANIRLVEASAADIPFGAGSFDAVTCSHAFYELKGGTQDRALREILRVLKPGKAFLMMEHDLPERPLARGLFYIRLASMGSKRALAILRHERETLEKYFASVEKVATPTGRSKIMISRR